MKPSAKTQKVAPRDFGSTGRRVAAVGQGSWRAEEAAAAAVIASLKRGIDLGMTHIDTAEMYGAGVAEKLIGEALSGRRDEVFLVAKVLPGNASRRGTVAACERSLARLKTDRLDCYLLHWRGSYPLEETIAAFDSLVGSGKILSWGVSNFDVHDLEEGASIAGAAHPACNQVLYHLKERTIEHGALPWCEKHGTAVVAYTPFGEAPGIFTGRGPQAEALHAVAAEHGATARQLALAFLLRQPHNVVIPTAVGG